MESQHPPSAAIIPTDESEIDDKSVSAPWKTHRTRIKDNSSDVNMISTLPITDGLNRLKNALDQHCCISLQAEGYQKLVARFFQRIIR